MSNTFENLLSRIGEINDIISSRRWYFSGAKTYKIIHGISTQIGIFDDDGVPAKYDQESSDTITTKMFYDPRYREGFAKQYNQSYTNYVISISDESNYYAMNLQSAMEDSNVKNALNGYSFSDDGVRISAHANLRKIIAAAKAMNKLDIITRMDSSYEDKISAYYKNSENKSVIDSLIIKLRGHFGLGSDEEFNSYEALVDEPLCWYVSDDEKSILENAIEEYKTAIDKMYELAEKAAESGGTIINCINYNKPTISDNKYSYINISQIMVCISTTRTTSASDLDELIEEYIDEASDILTKENRKKIVIISIIIAAVILLTSSIVMISFKIWSSSKIKNEAKKAETKKEEEKKGGARTKLERILMRKMARRKNTIN